MPTLIVMVGPPGSGKSTWIREYLTKHPEFKVVSTDDLRRKILGNVSDNSKNAMIWATAHRQVKKYLQSGHDVILDAMNTSEKDRQRLKDYLEGVKYKIFYKLMPAEDLKTLSQRIKSDIESGKDRSNVPIQVIEKNIAKFRSDVNKIKKEEVFKE